MSQRPRFPALLYLQECGVLHFAVEKELCSWPINFRLDNLFQGDWLVDRNGVEWSIKAIAAPKVSFWRRLRHLSRQDQYRTVQVEYTRVGALSLTELKERTFAQIDRDPGDVMMQFESEEDLRANVSRAGTIEELIEYLGKVL